MPENLAVTRAALAWLQLDPDQRGALGDAWPHLANALADLARAAAPGGTYVGRRWDHPRARTLPGAERRTGSLPPMRGHFVRDLADEHHGLQGARADFTLVDEGAAPPWSRPDADPPSDVQAAVRESADEPPAYLTGAAVIDEVLRVTRQLAHEHRRDARDPAAVVVSPDVLEAMRKAAARQSGHPLHGIPKHPTGTLWGLPVEEDATLRPGCVGVRDAAGTFTLVALDPDAALGQAVREHRS